MASYLGYSRIGSISNFWIRRLSRLKFFSLLFSIICEANLFSFLNTCCYGNPFIRRSGNTSPSHFNFGCLQFLKQKLKEQLQRTRQNERNKESRTLGLEAIAELCRHGRIIYYYSKQDRENGILGLQPRDKSTMLGVKTKEYFLEEFT